MSHCENKAVLVTTVKCALLLVWIFVHFYLVSQESRHSRAAAAHKCLQGRPQEKLQHHAKLQQDGGAEGAEGVVQFYKHRSKRSQGQVIGAHFVGYQNTSEPRPTSSRRDSGKYFSWSPHQHPHLTYRARVDYAVDPDGSTFLEATQDGYYYIYTQVGIIAASGTAICHQTVSISNVLSEKVLMESCTSKRSVTRNRNSTWLDTSFQGRFFYLFREERVAVRSTQKKYRNMFLIDPTKSFFGLHYLGS